MSDPPSAGQYTLPLSMQACKNSETYKQRGRTIVVCLDGTGDKFDNDYSNIIHLVKCLKKDDRNQVTYYQAGIGTYSAGGLSGGVSAAMDMAVGSGLGLHVRDAYQFLMHAYKEGDKICIFGFSRGAYTARCLAGMVHKIGLLPPRNLEQIPFAYEFYKNDTPEGWAQSQDFKKTFCIDVSVYFVGVFDSVASVGLIPRQLPLSSTPYNKAHYFRHAIALDERRSKFKVCRYQAKDFKDMEEGKWETPAAAGGIERVDDFKVNTGSGANGKTTKPVKLTHKEQEAKDVEDLSDDEYERVKGHKKPRDTNVEEVWFLGCHADVGGGAVPNDVRHKLAQIPLRWMIRQCFECKTGILFNTRALAEEGLDVHTLWPKYSKLSVPDFASFEPTSEMMEQYKAGLPPIKHRSKKLVPIETSKKEAHFKMHLADDDDEHVKKGQWMPEQIEDYFDSLSPSNDQLIQAKTWWILEIWPVEYHEQKADSEAWQARTGMNLGRYRAVFENEPKLHWTVQNRINTMDYKMGARFTRNVNHKHVC